MCRQKQTENVKLEASKQMMGVYLNQNWSENLLMILNNDIKAKCSSIFLTLDNVASHKKCTQFTKAYWVILTGWSILLLEHTGVYKLRVVKAIYSLKYFSLWFSHFFKNWLRTSTKSVSSLLDSGHISNFSLREKRDLFH